MKFSKLHILIFLLSFAITIFVVWLILPANRQSENLYFRQSYDMRQLRLDNADIEVIKIGDKLDVANIKNIQGESLLSVSDKKLFLLVAVKESCPACSSAKDMMEEIRKTVTNTQIAYYPVSTDNSLPDETEKYAQSLGFAYCFYVASDPQFSRLLTPSHILIDKNGTVIQTWLGASNKKDVRQRMSYQISSDLLLISDVFQSQALNKLN